MLSYKSQELLEIIRLMSTEVGSLHQQQLDTDSIKVVMITVHCNLEMFQIQKLTSLSYSILTTGKSIEEYHIPDTAIRIEFLNGFLLRQTRNIISRLII